MLKFGYQKKDSTIALKREAGAAASSNDLTKERASNGFMGKIRVKLLIPGDEQMKR